MHSNINDSERQKIAGHSENSTNITSTIDSDIRSTYSSFNPQGIQVERGVDFFVFNWDSRKELMIENNTM